MTPDETDAALLAQAVAWSESNPNWNVERCAEIARSQGLDFATALVYRRLLTREVNAKFLERAQAREQSSHLHADLIGIVPGAFHREHRHTGADGARILHIARKLGCPAEVIPTGSFGTCEENALVIRRWLTANRGRRIVLLSLSKGSVDVKCALAQAGAADTFADVAAWVSLSGMVQGTPLVSWLRQRRLRWWLVRLLLWWQGHRIQALQELSHESETALAAWPVLPSRLRVVHVYGFPLARHLSHRWAPKGYARLSSLGPNDGGGILLADLLALPGIVCPLWGADHYLMPIVDIAPRLRGIVTAAVE